MQGKRLIVLVSAVFAFTFAFAFAACGDGSGSSQGATMRQGTDEDPAAAGAPAGSDPAATAPSPSSVPPPAPAPGEEPAGATAPAGVVFAATLELDFSKMKQLESGLYVQDVAVGLGMPAVNGMGLTVHYTGWLPDGTKFDSSRDRNEAWGFNLAPGQVIDGWVEGIAGLRVGGKRRLVIPPDLGYGAGGFPPLIPSNSWLVFDVELMGATG